MTPETGPYLKAALICTDVIEGKDGVLTLIRVIDRITVTAAGPKSPARMPPVRRPFKLVLMFISGRARGSYTVELKIEHPDATIHEGWSGSIFLEGEDRGASLIADMDYEFGLEGLYWFQLLFDGSHLTRLPFRLIYQRVGGGTTRQ